MNLFTQRKPKSAMVEFGLRFSLMARIGKSGGDHHYPDDHEPLHVHKSGDDGLTKIDLSGNPLSRQRPMTHGERKAFKKLYKKILKVLSKWM